MWSGRCCHSLQAITEPQNKFLPSGFPYTKWGLLIANMLLYALFTVPPISWHHPDHYLMQKQLLIHCFPFVLFNCFTFYILIFLFWFVFLCIMYFPLEENHEAGRKTTSLHASTTYITNEAWNCNCSGESCWIIYQDLCWRGVQSFLQYTFSMLWWS